MTRRLFKTLLFTFCAGVSVGLAARGWHGLLFLAQGLSLLGVAYLNLRRFLTSGMCNSGE